MTTKPSIMVLEPPFGYSPNDISKYYIKAFNKLDYRVINFPAHKHLSYHSLSSDYLTKIGAIQSQMSRENVMDLVQTQMMGSVMKARPDVLIVVHGHCFDKYVIRDITKFVWSYGGVTCLILTESPHDKEEEIMCSSLFDFVFTTDSSANSYIKNSVHLGHSYEDSIHVPRLVKNSDYKVDVAFVGSFFKERASLFSKIADSDFTMYLSGIVDDFASEVSDELVKKIRPIIKANEELPFLYSGANFSLNFIRKSKDLFSDVNSEESHLQKSLTIRMVECMASGGVLVSDDTEESNLQLEDGVDYISFKTYEELLEKLNFYKNKPETLYAIRQFAYNKIRQIKNSYTQNAEKIITTIT